MKPDNRSARCMRPAMMVTLAATAALCMPSIAAAAAASMASGSVGLDSHLLNLLASMVNSNVARIGYVLLAAWALSGFMVTWEGQYLAVLFQVAAFPFVVSSMSAMFGIPLPEYDSFMTARVVLVSWLCLSLIFALLWGLHAAPDSDPPQRERNQARPAPAPIAPLDVRPAAADPVPEDTHRAGGNAALEAAPAHAQVRSCPPEKHKRKVSL